MSLRRRLGGSDPVLDLTPASDIIFSLLLFFILTQNFLTTLPMILPTISVGESASQEHPLRLAVDASGTISLEGVRLPATWKSELASRASALSRTRRSLLIELDQQAPAGIAVEALDVLRRVGITRVAFVANPAPEATSHP